jgi:hypothetical protein
MKWWKSEEHSVKTRSEAKVVPLHATDAFGGDE